MICDVLEPTWYSPGRTKLVRTHIFAISFDSYFHISYFHFFTCPGYGSPHNKAYDTEYALAALQNQVFFRYL